MTYNISPNTHVDVDLMLDIDLQKMFEVDDDQIQNDTDTDHMDVPREDIHMNGMDVDGDMDIDLGGIGMVLAQAQAQVLTEGDTPLSRGVRLTATDSQDNIPVALGVSMRHDIGIGMSLDRGFLGSSNFFMKNVNPVTPENSDEDERMDLSDDFPSLNFGLRIEKTVNIRAELEKSILLSPEALVHTSKPSPSPEKSVDQNWIFSVHTSGNDPKNYIGRMKVDFEENSPRFSSIPVAEPISDLMWADPHLAYYSSLNSVGMINMQNDTPENIDQIKFAPFHIAPITAMEVHPHFKNLVLTGGADARVFITDVIRYSHVIKSKSGNMHNSLYSGCSDVITSVAWSKTHNYTASMASRSGELHFIDMRTDSLRNPHCSETRPNLNAHAYIPGCPYKIILGCDDGRFSIYDIRTHTTISDHKQFDSDILDIQFNEYSTFMHLSLSEISLWNASTEGPILLNHLSMTPLNPNSRIFCSFLGGENVVASTNAYIFLLTSDIYFLCLNTDNKLKN